MKNFDSIIHNELLFDQGKFFFLLSDMVRLTGCTMNYNYQIFFIVLGFDHQMD